MYKGYNGAVFSLQIKDLLEVYIKSPKREVPVFKKPDMNNITNYPVFLPDPETDVNTLIYYARDEYQRRRFMNSIKYKKALALGMWSWSMVFDD